MWHQEQNFYSPTSWTAFCPLHLACCTVVHHLASLSLIALVNSRKVFPVPLRLSVVFARWESTPCHRVSSGFHLPDPVAQYVPAFTIHPINCIVWQAFEAALWLLSHVEQDEVKYIFLDGEYSWYITITLMRLSQELCVMMTDKKYLYPLITSSLFLHHHFFIVALFSPPFWQEL